MENSLLSKTLKILLVVLLLGIVAFYIFKSMFSIADSAKDIKTNSSRPTVDDIINGNY